MMKSFKYIALSACAVMSLGSCNDFLDKLPDDRAEIDTEEKVTQLLASAYVTSAGNLMQEMSSDNVSDYSSTYTTSTLIDEVYRFKNIDDQGHDSPYMVWNAGYNAVATANEAIRAMEEMGNPVSMKAQMAEAKLCRAYAMFMMANTFCMAWNPDMADEYLGLPYPTKPETSVDVKHKRGTLRELYEKINKDIEDALPDVDDNLYAVPKYHFNRAAAYAFAARFNLYYLNDDKCIEYANKVLGNDPKTVMRDFEPYLQFGAMDIGNRYIKTSENANLLLVSYYSILGRTFQGQFPRFNHNSSMAQYETFWAEAPWGAGSSSNTLYYANMLYGSNPCVIFPKMLEQFEYTDKLAGTGYVHTIDPVFTGDETLLCRAEAYIRKGDFDKGIADMNTWIETHCKETVVDDETGEIKAERPVLTLENIKAFIDELDIAPVTPEINSERTIRKQMHPQGFTINADQEAVLHILLHMRRLESLYQGLRFIDIKRYGIAFSHIVRGEEPLPFNDNNDYLYNGVPGADKRGAIQLPDDVINAGLEANPR